MWKPAKLVSTRQINNYAGGSAVNSIRPTLSTKGLIDAYFLLQGNNYDFIIMISNKFEAQIYITVTIIWPIKSHWACNLYVKAYTSETIAYKASAIIKLFKYRPAKQQIHSKQTKNGVGCLQWVREYNAVISTK